MLFTQLPQNLCYEFCSQLCRSTNEDYFPKSLQCVFGLAVNLTTSLCLLISLLWNPHSSLCLYWVPIVFLCTALRVMNFCSSMNTELKIVILAISYLGHLTLVSRCNLSVLPFISLYTSYYYTTVTSFPVRVPQFLVTQTHAEWLLTE